MAREVDRFEVIEKIIRISNSAVDIERRLKNILQLFQHDLGVDQACLFNLDRDTGVLVLRTIADDDQAPDIFLELTDSLLGRVAIRRQPVMAGVEELQNLTGTELELVSGYEYLVAYPIVDDQVLYGVLALLFKKPQDIAQPWIELIKAIAREMAGTIRNSRLYTDSKKRIAELSVLYEVGRAVSSTIELDKVLDTVVNITSKVLQAEGSALNVLDAGTGILRVAAEYGVIPAQCSFKHLIDRSQVHLSPDVLLCVGRKEAYVGRASGDPACPRVRANGGDQSIICLPLHFKGNFRGTLSVFNKTSALPGRQKEFNRGDLELLSTMGAMISSSLENALTFQAVDSLARRNERLVRRLSTLYEISGAMMTTVKMDELLDIITNALTLEQGLGFDRTLVLVMNEEEDALLGAAVKEVGPDDRHDTNLTLAEQLRALPNGSYQFSDWESEFLNLELPLRGKNGVLVRTAQEKEAFLISPENGVRPLDYTLPEQFGRQGFAAVPMLAKGKVVGVIAVDQDLSGTEVTAEDLRTLSMLANQAGLAIENSQLYEYIEQANLVLSQTKERLLEAEKLAALGEMAAGMAHEIRNPLVSIGGFTRRLLKNLEQESPHRVYIEVIINEVTRLEKTLSEVLDFSRDTLGHLDEQSLNEILNDSLYILRRNFRDENIEVDKDLRETPPVLVDERQIKHVFFNIFFNAIQAMPHGGVLYVKTYPTMFEDRAFVACEISDTGPGIPPETLPNIFNPFFTTKDTGTGLGLSIVHKIVSRHQGLIDVVNREERGATFIVKLPVAEEAGLYLK